jgi:hypothetical protein
MTRYAYSDCSLGTKQSGDVAIKYIYDVCANQAQSTAKKLTALANGIHADEFLSIFENEVERAIALSAQKQSWGSKIEKISKDAGLLLLRNPMTDYSHFSQLIATEGAAMGAGDRRDLLARIAVLEGMRRAVQIFLLLRSATKRLKLILSQGADRKTSPDMQGNADDLFCLMVDEHVRLLGPVASGGGGALREGSTVVMKRRQCVAAFIIRSAGGAAGTGGGSASTSPAQSARTSFFSRSPPAPLSPAKAPASGGGIGSLCAAPVLRTAERNRKTGDVYFIIDDESVLIASPDKARLDEGIVRICFPVYNAVAMIDKADPRDLRVLVQSSSAIPGMNEVSCNAFPSSSALSSPFKDLRPNYSLSPISGNNLSPQGAAAGPRGGQGARRPSPPADPFGPPIVSLSTWEVSIGFESAKNCEIVAQHITTSR